jgi:hypothetical protein
MEKEHRGLPGWIDRGCERCVSRQGIEQLEVAGRGGQVVPTSARRRRRESGIVWVGIGRYHVLGRHAPQQLGPLVVAVHDGHPKAIASVVDEGPSVAVQMGERLFTHVMLCVRVWALFHAAPHARVEEGNDDGPAYSAPSPEPRPHIPTWR